MANNCSLYYDNDVKHFSESVIMAVKQSSSRTPLLLENVPGGGRRMGGSLEDLARLQDALKPSLSPTSASAWTRLTRMPRATIVRRLNYSVVMKFIASQRSPLHPQTIETRSRSITVLIRNIARPVPTARAGSSIRQDPSSILVCFLIPTLCQESIALITPEQIKPVALINPGYIS